MDNDAIIINLEFGEYPHTVVFPTEPLDYRTSPSPPLPFSPPQLPMVPLVPRARKI